MTHTSTDPARTDPHPTQPPKRPRRRAHYVFTPARRRAFERASKKRTFKMTPAKWAAVRKAAEANKRNWRLTPARLAAMKMNGRRMQRASVEKFQMTEARRKANAISIRKAQAAPRTPESRARSRFNHLQHGLYVRSLEETMRLMGEDPAEFEAHKQRVRRAFAPACKAEEKVVDLLASITWRRLRLFHAQARYAQARWEGDRLKKLLSRADGKPLDLEQTRYLGLKLLEILCDRDNDKLLTTDAEREVRVLLSLRSGNPSESLFTKDADRIWRRFDKLEAEMAAELEAETNGRS